MNYSSNGKFGLVRLGAVIPETGRFPRLSRINQCGWHHVNSLYHVERPNAPDEYMFYMTVSGRGFLSTDGEAHFLEPNTVYITTPRCQRMHRPAPGGDWEFFWIRAKGGVLPDMVHSILSAAKSSYFFIDMLQIRRLMNEMINLKYEGIRSEVASAALLTKVLFCLLDAAVDKFSNHQTNHRVIQMLDYIAEHCAQTLSLDDLSRRFYMSREHLIRVFKAYTGMTPYSYCRLYRIALAKRELQFSDAAVSELALKYGYRSVSSFSAQFKKETGKSPSEYRQTHSSII